MTEEAREAAAKRIADGYVLGGANSTDVERRIRFETWLLQRDAETHAAGVAEGIRLAREAARAGFDELSGNIGANAHDQMWMKSGATVISAKLEKLTTRD